MLLTISNISAYYSKPDMLSLVDISLHVDFGEIVALLGPNGAGKSTVLRAIFKEIHITCGELFFEDKNITKEPANQLARIGIGYIPEKNKLFSSLTVEENLDMGGYILNNKKKVSSRKEMVFDLFPFLADHKKKVARKLSGGEQQMVALGRALMIDPKLLLLDEPSLGLAPQMVDKVFAMLNNINDLGVAILLVEQNVKKALEISHRVYVLNLGNIEFAGTPEEIRKSNILTKVYLGN